MEEGRVDPLYDQILSVKTVVSGHSLDIDAGAVLRAIDTVLIIAPRELRSPLGWMHRLYKARADIAEAIAIDAETVIEKEERHETLPEEDLDSIFGKGFSQGEGNGEHGSLPDISESPPRFDNQGVG